MHWTPSWHRTCNPLPHRPSSRWHHSGHRQAFLPRPTVHYFFLFMRCGLEGASKHPATSAADSTGTHRRSLYALQPARDRSLQHPAISGAIPQPLLWVLCSGDSDWTKPKAPAAPAAPMAPPLARQSSAERIKEDMAHRSLHGVKFHLVEWFG